MLNRYIMMLHRFSSRKSRFVCSIKFILVAFKLAGGEQHFMLFADGKSTGIAALAAQGGVATLTERSDATFSVMQFSSADRE